MAQTTIQALRLNPRLCPSHCHTLSTLHNVPSLGCSPVFTPGFRFVKVSDHHIQSTDGHMHGCASAEVTIITGLGVVIDALGMRSSHYGNKRGACANYVISGGVAEKHICGEVIQLLLKYCVRCASATWRAISSAYKAWLLGTRLIDNTVRMLYIIDDKTSFPFHISFFCA